MSKKGRQRRGKRESRGEEGGGGVDLYVGQNSRQRGAGFQTGTCPEAVLVFVFFSFQIHRGTIVLTEVKGGIMLPPDSRQQTPLMAVFM